MRMPNFLVIGVARCGTTSLINYLSQHPDISFGLKKEPKYITFLAGVGLGNGPGDLSVYQEVVKSSKEYKRLYNGLANKKVGDASSDTFYFSKSTIPIVKEKFGDIPIIIVIRNPVQRIQSAYNNLIRDSRETQPIEKALDLEDARVKGGYDWMWHYKSASFYSEKIVEWKNAFSRVKIVLNEEINSNDELNSILHFLDIDSSEKFLFNVKVKYSHSGKISSRFFRLFANRSGSPFIYFLRRKVIQFFPRKILEKAASKLLTKELLPLELKKTLLEEFDEEIKNLERVIKRDLSSWRRL